MTPDEHARVAVELLASAEGLDVNLISTQALVNCALTHSMLAVAGELKAQRADLNATAAGSSRHE